MTSLKTEDQMNLSIRGEQIFTTGREITNNQVSSGSPNLKQFRDSPSLSTLSSTDWYKPPATQHFWD